MMEPQGIFEYRFFVNFIVTKKYTNLNKGDIETRVHFLPQGWCRHDKVMTSLMLMQSLWICSAFFSL